MEDSRKYLVKEARPKECVICGQDLIGDYYKPHWKNKCLDCYRKNRMKGWGNQKEKINKLQQKHNPNFKLKAGRELIEKKDLIEK